MNEKTKNLCATFLVVFVGLAAGIGTVAWLNKRENPGFIQGDYSDLFALHGSDVLLFTIPGCDYCTKAREWLHAHEVGFRELSLATQPQHRETLTRLTEIPGVPVAIIGDVLVTGYNEELLRRALEAYNEG